MHAKEHSQSVRVIFMIVGVLATAGMLAISMRLNWLYGYSLGETPERGQVFGGASVAADVWKSLGPVFIYALWRAGRRLTATVGALLWTVCLIFAITSALGIAAQDRMSITGGRESLKAGYDDARAELEEKETRRKQLGDRRAVAEVEASIATAFARPLPRGTVGTVSNNCTKVESKTTDACSDVARLRQELASAVEASRLDQRITELRKKIDALRERGGTLAANPQAELISWISRGFLSVRDISFGVMLLLAGVIELVSACGFVVIAAYADATRRRPTSPDMSRPVEAGPAVSRPTALKRDGQIIEYQPIGSIATYIRERTEPTASSNGLDVVELCQDYERWCRRQKRVAMDLQAFTLEFDRVRALPEINGKITKRDTRYFGIQFVDQSVVKITARKMRKG